jgi:hypothetical protein
MENLTGTGFPMAFTDLGPLSAPPTRFYRLR